MRTFSIHTLGCKVNQYESEQVATLLRARGLVESASEDAAAGAAADIRIVNTCSVTGEAAAKSRQATRRAASAGNARRSVSLSVLPDAFNSDRKRWESTAPCPTSSATNPSFPPAGGGGVATVETGADDHGRSVGDCRALHARNSSLRQRVIVIGCWGTSNTADAEAIAGVDAVITHHDDVARRLGELLDRWAAEDEGRINGDETASGCQSAVGATPLDQLGNEVWMKAAAGEDPVDADSFVAGTNKPLTTNRVKENLDRMGEWANGRTGDRKVRGSVPVGASALPLLGARYTGHQRAFLKVQDGCDAHCTYCIIPSLRPRVWSKPVEAAVEEARRLVAAGHSEIVLTGIFLGAYGQETALRRRQGDKRDGGPIGELLVALCERVGGLKRLRLSSLEPGDLDAGLLRVMRGLKQVVPHFHLPLQSGSERVLRKMNRQYARAQFLEMIAQVNEAFDRPAITTDIIVGFPGESEEEFGQTLDVVDRARFIHIHAFPFSPREGTAAARWQGEFVRGDVSRARINALRARTKAHSLAFRRQFVGEGVEVLVERPNASDAPGTQHGRTERYFDVAFEHAESLTGRAVRVRVDRVEGERTFGTLVSVGEP